MPVCSMTGFARKNLDFSIGENHSSGFWEIKSVNGKSLDFKIKLPPVLEGLSRVLKDEAAKYFNRGNISIFLDLKSESDKSQPHINENLLQALVQKSAEIYEKQPDIFSKPQPAALFSCFGVIEQPLENWDEDLLQKLSGKLAEEFELACREMLDFREQEGAKISKALVDIIGKINILTMKVEKIAETIPSLMREKLQKQLAEWKDAASGISEERIAQELVLYVTRADIREEVDRLKAHVQNFLSLLESGQTVGRKLDFLCQELNREANTTCSKSCDVALTNCGMELKALIEQLREQVQNIE